MTDAVDKLLETFEQFTKKNDELLKAKAEGKAVADLTEIVEKLSIAVGEEQKKAAEERAETLKHLTEIEKKSNRPKADGEKKEDTPEMADYRKALGRYIRTGDEVADMKALGRKAMNTGSDPDGGYLVLPEMDLAIDRVAQTMGGLALLADTITIGTAKWEKLVKTSGMAMRRVADGATGGETTEPKYAKVAIEVFPAEVEPWVYNETLEDARINLETDLADEAAIGFAEGANAEYITGNGVGCARGITAYPVLKNTSYAWGSVGVINVGKSGAFMSVAPADRVVDLVHALKAQYRAGAQLVMNDTTLGVMRQMKDGSGAYYLWQPDALGSFGGRILGVPVTIDDNMPAIGAGSLSVAYGNFKRGYKIVNRSGTTLIRDNITAKGQTKFNFRRRFGGGIVNYEAIKLLRFTTGT